MSGSTAKTTAEKRYLVRVNLDKLRAHKTSGEILFPGKDLSGDMDVGNVVLREMTAADLQKLQTQTTIPGKLQPAEVMEWQEITTTPAPTAEMKYGHGGVAEYAVYVGLSGGPEDRESFFEKLRKDPHVQKILKEREVAFGRRQFTDYDNLSVLCDNQHDAFVMRARIDALAASMQRLKIATAISEPRHAHLPPMPEAVRRQLKEWAKINSHRGRDASEWAQTHFGPLPQNTLSRGVASASGADWMDTANALFGLRDEDKWMVIGDSGLRTGHAALYSNPVQYYQLTGGPPGPGFNVFDPNAVPVEIPPATNPGDIAPRLNHDVGGTGHGTWVGGLEAAIMSGATLIDGQVVDVDGHGPIICVSRLLDQILILVKKYPDKTIAVNFSLTWPGSGDYDPYMQATIDELNTYDNFVGVFAAAGNFGQQLTLQNGYFPASFKGVIAVGSATASLANAPYSNWGSRDEPVPLAATGSGARSQGLMSAAVAGAIDATAYKGGTSMSTPNVAGYELKFYPLFRKLFPGLTKADFFDLINGIALDPADVQYVDWSPGQQPAGADEYIIPTPIFNLDLNNLLAYINDRDTDPKYRNAMAQAVMPSSANGASAMSWLTTLAATEQLQNIPRIDDSAPSNNNYPLHNQTPKPLNVGDTVTFKFELSNVGPDAFLNFGGTSASEIPPNGLDQLVDYYGADDTKVFTRVFMPPTPVGNINIPANGKYTITIKRLTAVEVALTVTGLNGAVIVNNQPVVLKGTGDVADFRAQLRTYNCQVTGFDGFSMAIAPTAMPSQNPTARATAATKSPTKHPLRQNTPTTQTRVPSKAPSIAAAPSTHPSIAAAPSKHPSPEPTTSLPSAHPSRRPSPSPLKVKKKHHTRYRPPTRPVKTGTPTTATPTAAPEYENLVEFTVAPTTAATTVATAPASPVPYTDCWFLNIGRDLAKMLAKNGEFYCIIDDNQVTITPSEIVIQNSAGVVMQSQTIDPPINFKKLDALKISNNIGATSISALNSMQGIAQNLITYDKPNAEVSNPISVALPNEYGVQAATIELCSKPYHGGGRVLETFFNTDTTDAAAMNAALAAAAKEDHLEPQIAAELAARREPLSTQKEAGAVAVPSHTPAITPPDEVIVSTTKLAAYAAAQVMNWMRKKLTIDSQNAAAASSAAKNRMKPRGAVEGGLISFARMPSATTTAEQQPAKRHLRGNKGKHS